MRTLLPSLALLCAVAPALAQESAPANLQPVPDGAPEAQVEPGSETRQPEVTIRRRGEGVIEEYRVNGRLYMVRVVPRRGVPFYLIDSDGDGQLDVRRNDLDDGLMVPSWVLFSW